MAPMMQAAMGATAMDAGGMSGMNGMSSMGHGMSHDMRHGMMMMSPYLFTELKPFYVLFPWARVASYGELVAALFVTFLFSVWSTLFSFYAKTFEGAKHANSRNLVPTAAFTMRIFLHYIAMLLVMTMNLWVIIAVCMGHGVGYLTYFTLFGDQSASYKLVHGESYGACNC